MPAARNAPATASMENFMVVVVVVNDEAKRGFMGWEREQRASTMKNQE
jgi:hypothetical protein